MESLVCHTMTTGPFQIIWKSLALESVSETIAFFAEMQWDIFAKGHLTKPLHSDKNRTHLHS